MSYNSRVNIHSYLHGYCSYHVYLHIFTPTNVGIFLLKMCKMGTFFYFKGLYKT